MWTTITRFGFGEHGFICVELLENVGARSLVEQVVQLVRRAIEPYPLLNEEFRGSSAFRHDVLYSMRNFPKIAIPVGGYGLIGHPLHNHQ